MLNAKTQLYRPRGRVKIPAKLKRDIRSLKKLDFDSLKELIINKGYLFHAGDWTNQSVSYSQYGLDGSQALMTQGQFVSQGSLYFIPDGRTNGWICPLIKVGACNRGKINALEKRAGIERK